MPTYGQNFDDFNPFNDGRSLLDLHAGFTASLADTIGLAKWRTHKQVFWEYFEERKERERGRVFHVPRICGRQTFWFNGVVYSRELFGRHKYRRARFSLASSETGFIPPSSPSSPLCFIYRGETRRDIEKFVSQGVLSDAVENSVLKLSSPGWILFSRSMVEDEAWFLNSTLNDSKEIVEKSWYFESSSKFTRHRK